MSTVADLWALQTTDLALEVIKQRLILSWKSSAAKALSSKQPRTAAAEAEAELTRLRCSRSERSTARSRNYPTTYAPPSGR